MTPASSPSWRVYPRFCSFCLPILLLGVSGTAAAGVMVIDPPFTRTYLLAIGVERYSDPSLAPLRYSERDARSVFAALTNATSGLVRLSDAQLLLSGAATRSGMLSALSSLRSRVLADAEPDKGLNASAQLRPTVVLYYAGHSQYDEQKDELYFLPSDSRFVGHRLKRQEGDSRSITSTLGGVPVERELALAFTTDLLPAIAHPEINLVLIGDGCHIGDALALKLSRQYPQVSVISASKEDEFAYEGEDFGGGLFTKFLVEGLQNAEADVEKNGLISVEELHHYLYGRVLGHWNGRQHPSVSGRLRHRINLAKTPTEALDLRADTESDRLNLRMLLAQPGTVSINGRPVDVQRTDPGDGSVRLLGNFSGLVKKGVNYVSTLKRDFIFWSEGRSLVHYREPYKQSYAVLVAIDDYERIKDPEKRGRTGYAQRDNMTARADELSRTLETVGFPKSQIITLFNEKATSTAIEQVLQSFWHGGSRAHADRVFFYFGGHGDALERNAPSSGSASQDEHSPTTGFLVTYDFDARRPTLTGFLMKDLTGRHSENIRAHHVLIALDACHSGLAVYRTLGERKSARDLEDFKALSVIRSDTDPPARNVLVAGTANQSAVWDDGGIFTRALIAGLGGAADANGDGLIQFTELATSVRNQVADKAAQKGVRQQAMDYRLDAYGTGSVVFLRQRGAQSGQGASDKVAAGGQ